MPICLNDIKGLIDEKRKALHGRIAGYREGGGNEKEVADALTIFELSVDNLFEDAKNYHPDVKVAAYNRQTKLGKSATPFDPRFPNPNQTRHCFQSYVDYHRCTKLRGEDFKPCEYFLRTYKTICPSYWLENWDEQLQEGTFPVKI
uniref:Cytochrome c oxidase subunit 6B1 n=1 Tax=Lepeophtheirus salmonis TaxID=72036 RepID=C1BUK2_LEPSM|nr:Cytochrome c oxidase subunit VIb isoform 2 [Lepeophtheirus salmonis]